MRGSTICIRSAYRHVAHRHARLDSVRKLSAVSVGASEVRRAELVSALRDSPEPITGSELSSRLGVNRQAIVNDIAILHAADQPIIGSPRGYLLANLPSRGTDVIACRHGRENARQELEILVDLGSSSWT